MRKWGTTNRLSFSVILQIWHRTHRTIFFRNIGAAEFRRCTPQVPTTRGTQATAATTATTQATAATTAATQATATAVTIQNLVAVHTATWSLYRPHTLVAVHTTWSLYRTHPGHSTDRRITQLMVTAVGFQDPYIRRDGPTSRSSPTDKLSTPAVPFSSAVHLLAPWMQLSFCDWSARINDDPFRPSSSLPGQVDLVINPLRGGVMWGHPIRAHDYKPTPTDWRRDCIRK
jgi:hypothetical protein